MISLKMMKSLKRKKIIKNIGLKTLVSMLAFMILITPYASKVTIALSGKEVEEPKAALKESEKTSIEFPEEEATKEEANIVDLVKIIKGIKTTREQQILLGDSNPSNEHTAEEDSTSQDAQNPYNISELPMIGEGESTETVTIQTYDPIIYQELTSQKYGAVPTSNDLEVRMTRAQIAKVYEFDYLGSDNAAKQIKDIRALSNFYNLQVIKLNKNGISDIAPLQNLTHLKVLELQSNPIKELPDLKNTSLSVIDISHTSVKSLLGISKNTGLTKINASSVSNLDILPILTPSFASKETLKELYLEKCGITYIYQNSGLSLAAYDYSLEGLTNLEILNLNENSGITDIRGINDLSNLKELYLRDNNNIKNLKLIVETYSDGPNKGKVKLLGLKILDLTKVNNAASTIKITDINVLTNLEELYFSNNNPNGVLGNDGLKNVWKMQKLKVLDMSNDGIESIESLIDAKKTTVNGQEVIEVKSKSNVEKLILNDNLIENIDYLKYLKDTIKYLALEHNRIHNIDAIELLENIPKDKIQENLFLQRQEANFLIKRKTGIVVEQKIILDTLMQKCTDPNSIIYSSKAKLNTSEKATLNTQSFDTSKAIDPTFYKETTGRYDVPGYYNIIMPADVAVGDRGYVTITGGVADGSKFTFEITDKSEKKVYDSIVFEDINLNIGLVNALMSSDTKPCITSKVPYIILMEYPDIKNTGELMIGGYEIENVTGLQNFIFLKKLILSDNKISSDNEKSKIDYLKVMTELQWLDLSINELTNINVIENFKKLAYLDLSTNKITSLQPFENWLQMLTDNKVKTIPLTTLKVGENKIEDLTPIKDITTLKELFVNSNLITDIKPIENMKELNVLDISSNKISNIEKLSNFNKLKTLYMSNNNIKDLSSIDGIDIEVLNIAHNSIENIDALEENYRIQELSAQGNKIKTIAPIAERNSIKADKLDLSEQKIYHILGNEETINLPDIFKEAKTEGSYVYTDKDFKTNNYCELTEDGKVKVNQATIGNNVATVTIVGGKANGTQFAIGKGIIATVTYDEKTLTNKNVIASVSFDANDIRITNPDGKNTHVFTQNGTYDFEYENEYGLSGKVTATVTWIDKTAPTITGVNQNEVKKEPVTITASDENLTSVVVKVGASGNTFLNLTGNETTRTFKIDTDGIYTITATDKAGNKSERTFTLNTTGDVLEVSFPEKYKVQNENNIKYLTSITPKTTITTLKGEITTNGEQIDLLDKDGKVTQATNLATGMKLRITKGDQSAEYVIVVTGDCNGNGSANVSDVTTMKVSIAAVLAGNTDTSKILSGAYQKAADLTNDNKINVSDITNLCMYIAKNI